jgi:CRISPR-associated endonuclease/helicase Cas3
MKKKDYGTSRDGVKLTDELIEKLVEEAEAGYDLRRLRPRRGRPPMGDEAATVFQVRLEPELRQALEKRAKAEGTTPSDVVRTMLRAQLSVDGGGDRRKSP